jgi:hypothetical protein
MKCRRIQRLLPDYIGAELSDLKRHKVDQHLKACPGCRGALGQLQEVWDGLVEQPLPQKDAQFWEKLTRGVMQEIRRKQSIPAHEKRPFFVPGWRVLLPAATVIAIIVGVIVIRGGLQGPADRGLWIAPAEQEALVEATADLSFAPLAQEAQDPLGTEMTLQEASLVAEALSTSLQLAETTGVLTQLYNEEDPYGQLEDLTREEQDAFLQLLSSKYPYS